MLGSVEDDGDTPRCACVALHRIGPKLALDSLGRWVLVLILREGDLVVYEHDGQWRRVAHDFLGRPDPGTVSDLLADVLRGRRGSVRRVCAL